MGNNVNESNIEKEINENINKNLSSFVINTAKNLASLVPYCDKLIQFGSDLNKYSDNNEMLRILKFFYGINYEDNPNILTGLGVRMLNK